FFASSSSHEAPQDLHSFPTRRSSDLVGTGRPLIGLDDGDGLGSSGRRQQARPVEETACRPDGGGDRGDRPSGVGHRQIRDGESPDRKSTRLNSSHVSTSYAVFCLTKK